MLNIEPNTRIKLYRLPWNPAGENQIFWDGGVIDSGTGQNISKINYYSQFLIKEVINYTYVRKDNYIIIDSIYDEICNCNILSYINTIIIGNTSIQREIYCDITKMEYVNENATRIDIETNVIQTWSDTFIAQGAINRPCFVEREHVSNDSIGANIVSENISVPTLKYNSIQNIPIFEVSDQHNPDVISKRYSAYVYFIPDFSGVVNGSQAIFETGKYKYPIGTMAENSDILQISEQEVTYNTGYGSFINGIYSASLFQRIPLVKNASQNLYNIRHFIAWCIRLNCKVVNVSYGRTIDITDVATISRATRTTSFGFQYPTNLDGYYPRNNKLFTYPYSKITVSNNCGQSNDYYYEYFSNLNNIRFSVNMAIFPFIEANVTPYNYRGYSGADYNDSLSFTNYITSPWSEDSYATWWAQNQQTFNYSNFSKIATSIAGMAGGLASLATGNPVGLMASAGALGSGLLGLGANVAQAEKMGDTLDTVKGQNGGSALNLINNKCGFTAMQMSIPYSMAEKIDSYFDMYGYKINEKKIPAVNNRRSWNYVKTNNADFTCVFVPNEDNIKFNKLFDNGIRLWHKTDVGDYSASNTIRS